MPGWADFTDDVDKAVIEKEKTLLRCFNLFDVDKSGHIDAGELKGILSMVGNQDTRTISEKDAQGLIDDLLLQFDDGT